MSLWAKSVWGNFESTLPCLPFILIGTITSKRSMLFRSNLAIIKKNWEYHLKLCPTNGKGISKVCNKNKNNNNKLSDNELK